jgi:hypothetical protein
MEDFSFDDDLVPISLFPKTKESFPCPVGLSLREVDHKYFDRDAQEYVSQSAFISYFKNEFDAYKVSLNMAKGNPVKQKELLDEWEFKAKRSQVHGTKLHKLIEDYRDAPDKSVYADHPQRALLESICEQYVYPYFKAGQEKIWCLPDDLLCGTGDSWGIRENSRTPVVDFFDYKTNLEKGIQYKSKYKKYMLHCLTHMEDCNFNHYALQLSFYAYCAEMTHNIKVGRLAILFIGLDNIVKEIPVPYLRSDIINMLVVWRNR